MSDIEDDDTQSDDSLVLGNAGVGTSLPVETASYFCVGFCAIWALYNCIYRLSVYPYVSCIVILCHAILGLLRKQSLKFEEMYEISRVMASIIPMAAMNAHMLRCNSDASKSTNDFIVLISLAALPFILKMANPQRTESIVEIVVWANICTLGLNAIDRDFHLGMVITFWQGFYYLLTHNSHKWLLTDPEIPFNLGLSGSCILFCRLNSCNV